MFLPNSNLKVFRRPCFNLQPAPTTVRRERAGERVALRFARILLPKIAKPPPSQPSPAGRGKGQVAVAATGSVGFAREINAEIDVHSAVV